MMRCHWLVLCLLASSLLGACAGPGGIYEGARQSNDALRTPTERATQPSKPYEDYDRNRPGKSS